MNCMAVHEAEQPHHELLSLTSLDQSQHFGVAPEGFHQVDQTGLQGSIHLLVNLHLHQHVGFAPEGLFHIDQVDLQGRRFLLLH